MCRDHEESRTCEQHEEVPHLRLEADGRAEEMEGGRVLLEGEVDEAEVVEDLPVERCEVVGSLQTADRL